MTRLSEALEKACPAGSFDEQSRFIATILLDNMRSADGQMKSRMMGVVLSCAAFELLSQSAITQVSIFGVDLTELDWVHRFLPLLISYFYFSCTAAFTAHHLLQTAYDAMVRKICPDLYLSNLEMYMRPVYDLRVFGIMNEETGGRFQWLFRTLVGLTIVPLFLLVPAYIIYTYVVLFSRFGFDGLTILSALASILFVGQGLVLMLMNDMVQKPPGGEAQDGAEEAAAGAEGVAGMGDAATADKANPQAS
jgi:hypothetical protein